MTITTSPFVGRERELAALRELLEVAQGPVGAVAMLSGEPGIGKTATARAFADLARGEGFRVLWGTCHEGESSAPFGPWVQAVSPALRNVDLEARFGPAGAVLAQVVPIAGRRDGTRARRLRWLATRHGFGLTRRSRNWSSRLRTRGSWSCSTTFIGPTPRRSACWATSAAYCPPHPSSSLGHSEE